MQNKGKQVTKKQTVKPFDFTLCIIIFLLLALGIVMVLSASAPSSLSTTGNSYTYVSKQAMFAIAGIAAMLFISKIDYRKYKKYYKIAYWVAIALLLSVELPGLGVSVNGAKRWITVFGTRFQPSEIAKILLIFYYAGYLTDNKNNLKSFKEGCIPALIRLIPPIFLLYIIQDHLSAIIIIIIVTGIMMIMSGIKFRHLLAIGGSAGAALIAGMLYLANVAQKGSFRIARITSFLNPFADKTGDGWQVVQGLYAIGSGGLFGVGLGQSKQKYLYIPEPHNDFIFAVIAEELGFIGCLLVIGLFIAFIWRGTLTAMKAQDSFGSLLAVGLTSLVGIQAIMNIAVVTSSMPVTGISLPFFSYGGTALLILLCSMGVLLNISRSNSKI